ncbi:DUF2314 domain-containing protein [Glaciecola sp. 1036]|uniref:DUF2314 domain-containing protein n=1 Tax=Alteromonadaceae TaxID=72275 RepID=UPI003D08CBDD
MLLKKITILLILGFSAADISYASNSGPDIRYRSIVYFFPSKQEIDISALKNEFKSFELVEQLPNVTDSPVVSVSVINDVENSFPVPDLSYLAYFGRGLDKQQANQIQKSNLALVIDVAYPVSLTFDGLKDATISVFNFANVSDGLIWDSETRELYTPEAWKVKRIDSWIDNIPEIEDHTVIHAYQNNEGVRAITLGMAKFGLPDIVVNDFSWSLNQSMGNLINLVAQSLAEGLVPDEQGYLLLNIKELKNIQYKSELLATLKDNAETKVKIQIGDGKWEDGDPYNYIIELLFDDFDGASLSEKHESMLSSLFGWEDKISYVQHNQEIEAASERAKRKLNSLRDDFNSGLSPGEFIQVKAPFTDLDGGNEWMWVEVQSWKGNVLQGLLKNEPRNIPDLKGGAKVTVNQADVFDYIRYYPDGTMDGNETGALIRKYQR